MITGYLLLTFVRCGPCLLEEGNLQWQIAGIPGDQKNSDVFPGPTHARLVLASYFFPGGKILYSHSKESACNAGDQGVIPRSGRSPEEGMATHPSILAWRIPRTEEPGQLQSMVSQRVSHDWATNTHTHKLLLSDPKPLNFLKFVLKEMFPSLHAFHQADNIKTAVLFLGFED